MEGLGIESFRALLHKEEAKATEPEDTPLNRKLLNNGTSRFKEMHTQLQELSMMFSQEESEIVGKNMRGGDNDSDSDTESLKSFVPTSLKNRAQPRRIIDEINDPLAALANMTMTTGQQVNYNLPGVYKHVSQVISLFQINRLWAYMVITVSSCPPLPLPPNNLRLSISPYFPASSAHTSSRRSAVQPTRSHLPNPPSATAPQ